MTRHNERESGDQRDQYINVCGSVLKSVMLTPPPSNVSRVNAVALAEAGGFISYYL